MYGCYDFFFNDTATTEIYTLSLHDALPICPSKNCSSRLPSKTMSNWPVDAPSRLARSEEHTSELQSQSNLVCRLLLEKKNTGSRYANAHLLPAPSRLIRPHSPGGPARGRVL